MRTTGPPIYAINPQQVAAYRTRHSVSRKKSDHSDARALANILRTDAHEHRTPFAHTASARSITVLARAARDATWRRTKASNELRSLLRGNCRVADRPGLLIIADKGYVYNYHRPHTAAGNRPPVARLRTGVTNVMASYN